LEEYCTDTDDANYFNRGRVDFRYRNSDGEIVEAFGYDTCNDADYLTEFVCGEGTVPGLNYSPTEVYCANGCEAGKCNPETEESIIGNSCNYFDSGDSECEPENNIYCVKNVCTFVSAGAESYCNDSDGNNFFTKGTVSFSYRQQTDGNIMKGVYTDYCDENYLTEFKCFVQGSDLIPGPEMIQCVNECIDGKCTIAEEILLPETISDQQLLEFISKWAQEIIDNQTMIQVIEIWKNSQ